MIEYNVTLPANEWDIIGNALGQRPFVEVAALIQKLQAQVQAQQQQPLKQVEVANGNT